MAGLTLYTVLYYSSIFKNILVYTLCSNICFDLDLNITRYSYFSFINLDLNTLTLVDERKIQCNTQIINHAFCIE